MLKKRSFFTLGIYLCSVTILICFRLAFYKTNELIYDEVYYFPSVPFVDLNLEHPPFAKFLFSVVSGFTDHSIQSARFFIIIVAAFIPVFLFLEFGAISSLLCLLNPIYLVTSTMIMLEPIALSLALLGLLAFQHNKALVGGILFGLAVLSKWLILPFVFAFYFVSFRNSGFWKMIIVNMLTYILGFALLRSPDIIHSHLLMFEFHQGKAGVPWHGIPIWRFITQWGVWHLDSQHFVWLNPMLGILFVSSMLRLRNFYSLWPLSSALYLLFFATISRDHLYPYYLYYLIPSIFVFKKPMQPMPQQ